MSNSKVISEATNSRPQYQCFEYVSYELEGHTLRLHYRLTGGTDPDLSFCEVLGLPLSLPAPSLSDPLTHELLRACLFTFGVSYYKAALAPKIKGPSISVDEAQFWNLLYSEGMGEFYYRNGLPIPDQVGFEALVDASISASSLPVTSNHHTPRLESSLVQSTVLKSSNPNSSSWVKQESLAQHDTNQKALVLVGGGKDSGLVAEIAKQSGVVTEALSLGDSPWMESSSQASHIKLHRISRTIDPELLALNARGAWNGHVPISACIAAISVLVAHAGGFSDVLVGNERGADDANVEWNGRSINHQWSKSSLFESRFQTWCSQHASKAPRYASLLRPLSEIRIAAAFAKCKNQHPAFTSCNHNFRLNTAERPTRWCGRCAKCTFVALILSPHLSDQEFQDIFGMSVLSQDHNVPHLLALLGLNDVKPWDCVGTAKECWLSLIKLQKQGRLTESLNELAARVPEPFTGSGFDKAWEEEWGIRTSPLLSLQWQNILNAYLESH